MFLRALKRYFLVKRKTKAVNRPQEDILISGRKINTVLLVVPYAEFEFDSSLFSKSFGIANDKIIIAYVSEETVKEDVEQVFNPKRFDLFGKLKTTADNDLLTNDFDLLVCLAPSGAVTDFLLSHSKSSFKVGFLENDQTDMLHLELRVDTSDSKGYMGELLKYLKILKKI